VDFSFQGISNEIAANYMRQHGRATWRGIRKNLTAVPTCPKLNPIGIFTTAGTKNQNSSVLNRTTLTAARSRNTA
jgi:hypothetical protein